MNVKELLGEEWAAALPRAEELLEQVREQLSMEKAHGIIILPEKDKIFRVFKEVPLNKIRVLLCAQDPYANPIGQATGLTK